MLRFRFDNAHEYFVGEWELRAGVGPVVLFVRLCREPEGGLEITPGQRNELLRYMLGGPNRTGAQLLDERSLSEFEFSEVELDGFEERAAGDTDERILLRWMLPQHCRVRGTFRKQAGSPFASPLRMRWGAREFYLTDAGVQVRCGTGEARAPRLLANLSTSIEWDPWRDDVALPGLLGVFDDMRTGRPDRLMLDAGRGRGDGRPTWPTIDAAAARPVEMSLRWWERHDTRGAAVSMVWEVALEQGSELFR